MRRRRSDQFDMALQQAARGEKVEGRLAHLVETAQQMSVLSEPPPPPPNELAPGRRRFLAEAARLRAAEMPASTRRAWVPARFKLAGALVALVLVFGMVLGAGQVAADSLPGEFLYDLKLAGEGFRMALTADPVARADLSVALAGKRLDEIAELVDGGQMPDPPTVDRAARHLGRAMDATAEAGENAAPWAFQQLKAVIRIHRRTTLRLADAATEAEAPSAERFERAMERARLLTGVVDEPPAGEQEQIRHVEGEQAPDPESVPDPIDRPGPGPQPVEPPGESQPEEPLGPDPEPAEKPGEPQATDHPDLGPGPRPTDKPGEPNPTEEPGKGRSEDPSPAGEQGGQRRRSTPTPTPTPTPTATLEPSAQPGHHGPGEPDASDHSSGP